MANGANNGCIHRDSISSKSTGKLKHVALVAVVIGVDQVVKQCAEIS